MATHFSGPVDSKTGFSVNGTTVIDSSGNLTAPAGSVGSAELSENTIQYAEVTLTAAEIVGTAAGDIGATAGAPLVAAQAGKILEFVSAVLIYDYDTAAYTGGGDDVVIRQGTTAVSAAIAKADLLADTADDIAYVNALSAADIKLTANSTINLFAGTAFTQPGTAAGVLRCKVAYRVHTSGL